MAWSTVANQNVFILRRPIALKGKPIMARKIMALLMILSLFVSLANAHGHQIEPPEEIQIKQYRTEINELMSQLPPPEAREAYAAALASLRRKLRDLLIEKKERLTRDIQVLRSKASSPEARDYIQKLEAVISSITIEVEALDEALRSNLIATCTQIALC
jgi:hypothetical protein